MVSLNIVFYNIDRMSDGVILLSHIIGGTIMGYRIFDNLDKEVIYVNEQLLNGRSLTKIASEDYGYKSESSLRKRLTRGNLYKRVGQQFIKQCQTKLGENENKEVDIDVIQSVRQDVTSVENPSVLENREFKEMSSRIMSPSVTPSVVDDRFEELLSNYDILMKMIEEYKSVGMQEIKDNRLVIELPVENEEARATFRINGTVYDEFKTFVKEHKQFKVKELVSAALQEFVNKYK